MDKFLQRFGSEVIGHLSGFDRDRFRGSIRRLCYPEGLLSFLCWIKVLLKDFGDYANDTTNQLCTAIEGKADEHDLPADTEPLGELVGKMCAPVQWRGRRARGLNPLASTDRKLLEIVSRGDFMIQGFRNRDIREALHGQEKLPAAEQRRQSAAITRQLRLLQAHELIKKQPNSHRYQLTEEGQRAITTVLAACRANAAKLTETTA